jgi:hypothetical protein
VLPLNEDFLRRAILDPSLSLLSRTQKPAYRAVASSALHVHNASGTEHITPVGCFG